MKYWIATIFTIVFSPFSLAAQQPIYDPEARIDLSQYTCGQHLAIVEEEDGRGDVRTVWAHGYYSALRGIDENSPPITGEAVVKFAAQLEKACEQEPKRLLLALLKSMK